MLKRRRIWIVYRADPAALPPILTLVDALHALGENVSLIATKGLPDGFVGKRPTEYVVTSATGRGRGGKFLSYFRFRLEALRILEAFADSADLVWIASLDTALSLIGSSVLERHEYILQLHELYDTNPNRLRAVRNVARAALCVVVPEKSRAAILQVWLGLRTMPAVIPNKPFRHPRQKRQSPSTPLIQRIIGNAGMHNPIILYQGHIGHDRNLGPLARAVAERSDVDLWLMGRDHGALSQLLCARNITYLGYVTPPEHLEVTSYASIGVMKYDPINLNNVFCAPNKVFEYTGFGIPFISNDCPPLRDIVQTFNCGVISDFSTDINDCISMVMAEMPKMIAASNRFFDSISIEIAVENVIRRSQLGRERAQV